MPLACGSYDTDDFKAVDECCACGATFNDTTDEDWWNEDNEWEWDEFDNEDEEDNWWNDFEEEYWNDDWFIDNPIDGNVTQGE